MSNLGLHFKVKLLVNVKLLENGTDRAILRWRTNSKSYTFSRKYEWVTLVNRGVCRISARSGDVPLASRGLGCGGGDWAPPRKVIFCLQNDKFWCILLQFLTGRKHRRLGTRILQFNREITNSAKIIQKFTVRPGGGRTIAPPLNTPLLVNRSKMSIFALRQTHKGGLCSGAVSVTFVYCVRTAKGKLRL